MVKFHFGQQQAKRFKDGDGFSSLPTRDPDTLAEYHDLWAVQMARAQDDVEDEDGFVEGAEDDGQEAGQLH